MHGLVRASSQHELSHRLGWRGSSDPHALLSLSGRSITASETLSSLIIYSNPLQV